MENGNLERKKRRRTSPERFVAGGQEAAGLESKAGKNGKRNKLSLSEPFEKLSQSANALLGKRVAVLFKSGEHMAWYHGTVTEFDPEEGGFRIDYDDEDVQYGYFGHQQFRNADNQKFPYRWLEDGQGNEEPGNGEGSAIDLKRPYTGGGATEHSTGGSISDRWDGGQPSDIDKLSDEDFGPRKLAKKSSKKRPEGKERPKKARQQFKEKPRDSTTKQQAPREAGAEQPVKRKRGRPRKTDSQKAEDALKRKARKEADALASKSSKVHVPSQNPSPVKAKPEEVKAPAEPEGNGQAEKVVAAVRPVDAAETGNKTKPLDPPGKEAAPAAPRDSTGARAAEQLSPRQPGNEESGAGKTETSVWLGGKEKSPKGQSAVESLAASFSRKAVPPAQAERSARIMQLIMEGNISAAGKTEALSLAAQLGPNSVVEVNNAISEPNTQNRQTAANTTTVSDVSDTTAGTVKAQPPKPTEEVAEREQSDARRGDTEVKEPSPDQKAKPSQGSAVSPALQPLSVEQPEQVGEKRKATANPPPTSLLRKRLKKSSPVQFPEAPDEEKVTKETGTADTGASSPISPSKKLPGASKDPHLQSGSAKKPPSPAQIPPAQPPGADTTPAEPPPAAQSQPGKVLQSSQGLSTPATPAQGSPAAEKGHDATKVSLPQAEGATEAKSKASEVQIATEPTSPNKSSPVKAAEGSSAKAEAPVTSAASIKPVTKAKLSSGFLANLYGGKSNASKTTSIAAPASLSLLPLPAEVAVPKVASPKLESPGSSSGEQKVFRKSVEEVEAEVICGKLELQLAGLTTARDSIGKATATALTAAQVNASARVVRTIADAMEKTQDNQKRIAMLYLVDSILQRCQKKEFDNGGPNTAAALSYPRIISAALTRLVKAVGSTHNGLDKAVKVLGIWANRKLISQNLVNLEMAKVKDMREALPPVEVAPPSSFVPAPQGAITGLQPSAVPGKRTTQVRINLGLDEASETATLEDQYGTQQMVGMIRRDEDSDSDSDDEPPQHQMPVAHSEEGRMAPHPQAPHPQNMARNWEAPLPGFSPDAEMDPHYHGDMPSMRATPSGHALYPPGFGPEEEFSHVPTSTSHQPISIQLNKRPPQARQATSGPHQDFQSEIAMRSRHHLAAKVGHHAPPLPAGSYTGGVSRGYTDASFLEATPSTRHSPYPGSVDYGQSPTGFAFGMGMGMDRPGAPMHHHHQLREETYAPPLPKDDPTDAPPPLPEEDPPLPPPDDAPPPLPPPDFQDYGVFPGHRPYQGYPQWPVSQPAQQYPGHYSRH